ncbi:hypothetical protein Z959_07425 [Clostridium novyi B str. ATCC 27606]|uniref:Uncharacterized protein n=2 Tax=Clostridium TaxID=1485 RepID=A0AA40M616_CLONO|nr:MULTISPECIES: hypothetical protein [Clostridium]KEI12396.1 hypothetical protein Z958_07085 [Clostridium novyi B str. NCTC 9691]KEI15381.1 hypothetical protein Z960_00810 [Clostridium haemolyticum NCTC 9693]KEI17298.1 hypothetical protein Z959_07425 [Clostridium novyi B str. ATCC 27606]KGN04048.1 hypothetical protein Z961_05040 [Clostridium haemolyticum NCTC 8350]OOB75504.1 hypothetical protein AXF41_08125 [Clostridium haemolyticum]
MEDISLVSHLCKYIGQTVTIFTTSGGESGSGFTGILLSVNNCYVRLTTQVGPAPACALGNCCSGIPKGNVDECSSYCQRFSCSGNTVGSVTDIPISKIVSFVHNAL